MSDPRDMQAGAEMSAKTKLPDGEAEVGQTVYIVESLKPVTFQMAFARFITAGGEEHEYGNVYATFEGAKRELLGRLATKAELLRSELKSVERRIADVHDYARYRKAGAP